MSSLAHDPEATMASPPIPPTLCLPIWSQLPEAWQDRVVGAGERFLGGGCEVGR